MRRDHAAGSLEGLRERPGIAPESEKWWPRTDHTDRVIRTCAFGAGHGEIVSPTVSLLTPQAGLLAQSTGSVLSPEILMVGGVLIMTVCVFSMLRKRLRGRSLRPEIRQRPTPREHIQERHDARRSVESTVVEAEELVRRLAAHLDQKSARLEVLIQQADERIAQLSGRADAGPSMNALRPETRVEPKFVDQTSQDIYRLADDGLPPIEIAQQLSEGVGKVELILALREG